MMLNKCLSVVLSVIMMISLVVIVPVSSSAAETITVSAGVQYGAWSAWSTVPVTATSLRQVETRQVISSYDLEGNCCGNSNGARCYLKYMQNGYTLRLHYDRITRSKSEVDSWAQWGEGSYYTYASNVNGWIIGPGTAYIEPYNCVPYFIVGTNYETQYRYRDIIKTPLTDCTVTLSQTTYTYDGKPKCPTVTVKYGSKTLTESTDYTVKYSQNTDVGTATVTITGCGDYTGTVTKQFTIENAKKLSAPKNIKAAPVNAQGQIKVTWSAVSGATRYLVYYKCAGDNSWKKCGYSSTCSYTMKNCKSGVKYTFTVCVCDQSGNAISSCGTSGSTVSYLSTPKITTCQNVTNGIQLTWGSVNGAAKYRVYIKSGSTWKKLCDTKSTSYLYKSVKSGSTYTFSVRCISADASKFTSGYYTAGWKQQFIAVPKITKLQSTSSGVKLTWSACKGAVKYRVYIKSGSAWTKIGDTTGTTFTHKGAVSGKKYIYTIRCVSADGKSFRSAYSSTGWSITYQKPVTDTSNWKRNTFKFDSVTTSLLLPTNWGYTKQTYGTSIYYTFYEKSTYQTTNGRIGTICSLMSMTADGFQRLQSGPETYVYYGKIGSRYYAMVWLSGYGYNPDTEKAFDKALKLSHEVAQTFQSDPVAKK